MPVRTAVAALEKPDEPTVSAPVTVPFAEGVKMMAAAQLAPAGNEDPHVL